MNKKREKLTDAVLEKYREKFAKEEKKEEKKVKQSACFLTPSREQSKPMLR